MSHENAPYFEIKPAVRQGAPSLISLWGVSGCGKTLTALLIARGLVGPEGKIFLIDTENKRALYHADCAGGFDHLDMKPPFTPERYTAAIKQCEEAGANCVIIDSTSHCWEGEGGVIDMADNETTYEGKPKTGLAKWAKPKKAYKKMLNNQLRASCHVIFCLRSKEGFQQKGYGKEAKIQNVGLEPIMGKGFIYEMTVSILLSPDHTPVFPGDGCGYHCNPTIPSVKAPDALLNHITKGEHLGEKFGRVMKEWIDSGETVDLDAERVKRLARDEAISGDASQPGKERMVEYCKNQSDVDQTILRTIWAELLHLAEETERMASNDDAPPALDDEGPHQPASNEI